jgi:aldehyde dehydrogenase (NAD+)
VLDADSRLGGKGRARPLLDGRDLLRHDLQAEEDVAEELAGVEAFARRYDNALGSLYEELDQLEALLHNATEVLAKLKRRIAVLRVGDPLDKNTDLGAINSAEQLTKITGLVKSGVEEGAEKHDNGCKLPAQGFFFRPTIFAGVSMSHRIAREEIFGPVLSILTFRTLEEAVEKANNTPYGLSAGVWTDKGSRILKMSTLLKAGVVWANTYHKFDPTSPFGGFKESGFGREGGKQGLLDYLKMA